MDAPAACEVWFYHLERATLEQVLPELLEKTLSRGWRARVRSDEPGRLETLDTWLWNYREDSFLPHGLASDAFPDRQPILLGAEAGNPNGAQVLVAVDGDPGDLAGYVRCLVIFDGRDGPALQSARGLWTRYKRAGHGVTYWRQGASRGWEKQA